MDFEIQLIVIKTEYLRKKILLNIPLKKIAVALISRKQYNYFSTRSSKTKFKKEREKYLIKFLLFKKH
jgi:hypothetical protein